MTLEELKDLMHRLHLDADPKADLIYVFYRTPDGLVNNFSISVRCARQANRRPMSDEQLAELLQQYPDAHGATLLAVERPGQGLTQWLDTSEMIRRLNTTRSTLWRWRKRGLLHPSRLGGRLYYAADDVEALLRSNVIQENGRADTSGM